VSMRKHSVFDSDRNVAASCTVSTTVRRITARLKDPASNHNHDVDYAFAMAAAPQFTSRKCSA
jgi:hypothetical protein